MARPNNMARKLSKAPATRVTAISLSQDVAEQYEAQAGDVDLGAFLSARLEDPLVVAHQSENPIYFTDQQRRELDGMLGYNFKTAEQVLSRLKSLLTVIRISDNESIEDMVLSPNQLFRLSERARMAAKTVPQLAKVLAEEGINREIGLY